MNKVELHYYLEQNFHSMNATVKNRAEAVVLKILKEVSDMLDLQLDFEIEALDPGGIKEYFKILSKNKNNKTLHLILKSFGAIVSAVLVNVVSDKLEDDSELRQLKKDELKLKIEELKKEFHTEENINIKIDYLISAISCTDSIKLHKSNFYSLLLKENKIEKISLQELDNDNYPIFKERFVVKSEFKKFIIERNGREIEERVGVTIEIVSPVLRNGKAKWKGIYESQPITFHLKDQEFKRSVLNRSISFASGTTIQCDIELEKEMDANGNMKVISITVYGVAQVLQGDSAMVIKLTKRNNQNVNQMHLFGR